MNSLWSALLGEIVISSSFATKKGTIAEETEAFGSAAVSFNAAGQEGEEGI